MDDTRRKDKKVRGPGHERVTHGAYHGGLSHRSRPFQTGRKRNSTRRTWWRRKSRRRSRNARKETRPRRDGARRGATHRGSTEEQSKGAVPEEQEEEHQEWQEWRKVINTKRSSRSQRKRNSTGGNESHRAVPGNSATEQARGTTTFGRAGKSYKQENLKISVCLRKHD